MAAVRAIVVSTAESKRASGARKRRTRCLSADDAAAPSFEHWRATAPDSDALVDMGSFHITSCPDGSLNWKAHSRLLQCQESQSVTQSDCGRLEEASRSEESPLTVRVNLLSASELHPSLFAESRPPAAVLSLQGSSACHVALPATKISDDYAFWTDVALVNLPSSDDVTLMSSEGVHEPACRAAGGGKRGWSGAGPARLLPAGMRRSLSGRKVSPLVGPTPQEEAGNQGAREGGSHPQQGSTTTCLGKSSSAGPVLVVDVYSNIDRRKLLGRALVPLSPAVMTPGTPFIGTYGLERRGLLGLRRREGQVRVIITADKPSSKGHPQAD